MWGASTVVGLPKHNHWNHEGQEVGDRDRNRERLGEKGSKSQGEDVLQTKRENGQKRNQKVKSVNLLYEYKVRFFA
jgi:hypothetical protein